MSNPYRDALDYLYSFTDYEKQSGYVYNAERFDLQRVEQLLELLGNPHQAYRSVHIAGTKGKGSTSAIVASILRQAGYHTALYTSPHLHTFRERVQIDGQLISEQDVVTGTERLRQVAPQVPEITTFELITALAFDYFAHPYSSTSPPRAEWAVLEVGMGGRLDATNVVLPAVSVITSISYDHTMYLGDTLAAIAAEKAGIIKPGVPVVSAPQPAEAQSVIVEFASQRGAPLTLVGRDWVFESTQTSSEGQEFLAFPAGESQPGPPYALALLGRHQLANATTALATVDQLRRAGVHVPEEAVRAGLQFVQWPGRLEVLGRRPWVIVDGAHNVDSMQKLRAAIAELFSFDRLILIFGAYVDKDIEGMLDVILPHTDLAFVTRTRRPRRADPDMLVEAIRSRGRDAQAVPADQALDEALAAATEDDLICATGSLSVVAEVRAGWFRHLGQPLPPTDPE